MSRRISTKKRLPENDLQYDSLLVSILINRVLKKGKKNLAKRIVYKALELIKQRANKNPLFVLEKAVKNMTPRVQLKATRVSGATYQVPTLLSRFRSTNLAVCWAVRYAQKRSGKGAVLNLANELLEAAKGAGAAVRKKDEMHKMAEANKAFITLKES